MHVRLTGDAMAAEVRQLFFTTTPLTGTTSATASNVMTRVREVAKSKDYPDDHSNFRNIELRYEVNAAFALTK